MKRPCHRESFTQSLPVNAKGKKGVLVAMIKGTDSDRISLILKKIPRNIRHQVKEVTLDMAASMERIVKYNFPKAKRVTDRFHVQKLAN
jgi:transposase